MIDNIPALTSSVTIALLPTQLIAEILISRGMLYFPSRTTLVVLSLVRYKWSDVDIISGVSGRICVSVS